MLDDLKYIHAKDSQDALGIAAKQWKYLEEEFELPELNFEVDNIVFAGMGGSALWALLAQTWPGFSIPFEVWRRYDLPGYVGKNTLVIVSSYSGNTEETISALKAAERVGAHIVVAASGGKLVEIAEEKGYPLALLPKTAQPRYAALAGLKSLVVILEKAGLVSEGDAEKTLHETAEFLKTQIEKWAPDVPVSKNPAKKLALELAGTSPVVYAGSLMAPAGYKWKISFNENAKNVAWFDEIPEFSHNEFIGWDSHPVDKPYSIVDLRSTFEHPRVQKRFLVTERLLSGKRPAPHVVEAQGETVLEHLLYCVAFGDFVSMYVGLLNGVDIAPVDLVEKMKVELDK